MKLMSPQEKLKEIKDKDTFSIYRGDVQWLIARVEQLETAVKRADELFADDRQRTDVLNEALNTGPIDESTKK